jgi:hypothetical protein
MEGFTLSGYMYVVCDFQINDSLFWVENGLSNKKNFVRTAQDVFRCGSACWDM